MSKTIDKLRQHLPELKKHYHVKSMGVFGSWSRGEQGKGSDLDLLVEFDEDGPTLLGFAHLENYLNDLLGIKVDLVEKDTLKPAIGRRVLEEVQSL